MLYYAMMYQREMDGLTNQLFEGTGNKKTRSIFDRAPKNNRPKP